MGKKLLLTHFDVSILMDIGLETLSGVLTIQKDFEGVTEYHAHKCLMFGSGGESGINKSLIVC